MDERFQTNALFAGIAHEELAKLDIPIELLRLPAGEIICEEGDFGGCLYLVVSGAVQISKEGRGGKQEPLSLQRENGFFGEMAALDNQPRSARATVVAPTVLGKMNRAGLYRLLGASLEAAMQVVRLMARRLRSSSSLFIDELVNSERLSLVGRMMGSIVHDIRNPIANIVLATDYLASQEDDAIANELASIMQSSTDQMQHMIQELLDYSKGNRVVEPVETTVGALLESLDQLMLNAVERKGVTVRREIAYDGVATLDCPRVARLLSNVIKNSVEAMSKDGVLTLRVWKDGDFLEIEVADTGKGIPEDVLDRIYEPFVTHGKSGGTGLGMAIAKSVVEGHRGTIAMESEVGVGTTCRIRLPL